MQLRGTSWFGFEGNVHVVHGLWTRNWKDMITQMQALGFNSLWNATASATSGTVSFSGDRWNDWINPGVSAGFGYCATRTGVPPPPAPPPPSAGKAQFSTQTRVDNNWDSGYCARVQVTNTGSASGDWNVTVSVKGTITTLWNAIRTQSGSSLAARGVRWNQTLSPGAMAEFGFCAAG